MNLDLETIGLRVKMCRKKKGLTQEKLAELINVSPHYIYEIEKGMKTMSLSTLMNIAVASDTSTDYILFGIQSEHNKERYVDNNLILSLEQLSPQKRSSLSLIIKTILPLLK